MLKKCDKVIIEVDKIEQYLNGRYIGRYQVVS